MKTKSMLTLDDVKKIAAASEAEALQNNWAVTFAIVDDGGHLLWLQRPAGVRAHRTRQGAHRRARPPRVEIV
jgi:glc operon protein GlcG